MAAQTFGTAHLFGVSGTQSDATVISVSKNNNFVLTESTKDESGVEIERHYDDRTEDLSLTLKIQSGYTKPDQGDTLVYETVTYEIVSTNETQGNQEFRIFEITAKQSEGITYA